MEKQVYEIDDQGYIVEIHIAESDSSGNPLEELPENYVTTDPPQGLYRARWMEEEWLEDMSQEEIDALNNAPQPESPEEKIARLEAVIAQQEGTLLQKLIDILPSSVLAESMEEQYQAALAELGL